MIDSPQRRLIAIALTFTLALAACSYSIPERDRSSNVGIKIYSLEAREAKSELGVVSTGAVEATRVGIQILEQGGNAIDAYVAAAIMLAVVDPADSGLGGTTMALVRFADGRALAVEGACPVPMQIDSSRIAELHEASERNSIAYTAVPASLSVLAHLNRRYGTMPLADLIAPAIEVAENTGYTLSNFQVYATEKYIDALLESDHLRYMVLINGTDLPTLSQRFYRPRLAKTLRTIARRGAEAFYRGTIAGQIESDMKLRGGYVTRTDLAVIRARELRPLRDSYRDTEILTFPEPGAGCAVISMLNMLEQYPQEFLRTDSVDRLQVLAETTRLAKADKDRYRPDPNLSQGIRDYSFMRKDFAANTASQIDLGKAMPAHFRELSEDRDPCREPEYQTTQVSIIDRWGNVVSATQTLGNFYGAKIIHPELGIVYNNLMEGLCDPEPRKIFNNEMAPTIVLRDGQPLLALGSPSSSRIFAIVANVISSVVDRELGLGAAIEAPRALWTGRDQPRPRIEVLPPVNIKWVKELMKRGFTEPTIARIPGHQGTFTGFGGVNAVSYDAATGIATGVGDPRRDGYAAGARF